MISDIILQIGSHLNELDWIALLSTCKLYYDDIHIRNNRDIIRAKLYTIDELLSDSLRYRNFNLFKIIANESAKRYYFNNFYERHEDGCYCNDALYSDNPNMIRKILEYSNIRWGFYEAKVHFSHFYSKACEFCKYKIAKMYLDEMYEDPDPNVRYFDKEIGRYVDKKCFEIACQNKHENIALLIINHDKFNIADNERNVYIRIARKYGMINVFNTLLQTNESIEI